MIAILAPAKKLDFKTAYIRTDHEKAPSFIEKTGVLAALIRSLSGEEIMELMGVSASLAGLTAERFSELSFGKDPENERPAIFAFKGETYTGLYAGGFDKDDLLFAEERLRILSGLYGILSPLTRIEPYRLEMGLKLQGAGTGRLSHYWKDTVTDALNAALAKSKVKTVVNLASAEYLAAVDRKRLHGDMLDIVFKEKRDGKLKIIGTLAKKARGMMASFMVKERVDHPEELKAFHMAGYGYVPELSDQHTLTFVRPDQ